MICHDCNGTGWSGGSQPTDRDGKPIGDLGDACEVCSGNGTLWPSKLTRDLRDALQMPNFQCGPIAHLYQAAGEFVGEEGLELRKRSEDEQAFVLHKMVGLVAKHGDRWMDAMADELERVHAIVRAKAKPSYTELRARVIEAENAVRVSKDSMDSSNFHGRSRTMELQRLAAAARLELHKHYPEKI